MGKLFCLIGKSGVGKDTLFRNIIKSQCENIIPVIPYTTRPKRANEEDGVHYHFVSVEDMNRLEKQDKIIEKREYLTVHGIWYYFTVDFDINAENNYNYIIITTPEALKKLSEKIGGKNMIVIALNADDKIRLERSILRESLNIHPNYSEVCRRYLADEEDFKDICFDEYHSNFSIDANSDIINCLNQFKNIKNIKNNNS